MKTSPDEVNYCKTDDGHTALHIAAANNHLDMVCLLAAMVMPHTPHQASSLNHLSYFSDLRVHIQSDQANLSCDILSLPA